MSAIAALALATGCQPGYIERTWTRVAVSRLATGTTVAGAELVVRYIIDFDLPRDDIAAQSTDTNGESVLPVVTIGSHPYVGTLLVQVSDGEHNDVVTVRNKAGEIECDDYFCVEVLDENAAVADPPVAAIDHDSNRLVIDGYVAALTVCDCASRAPQWSIYGVGYLDSITPGGAVPEGFGHATYGGSLDSPCMLADLSSCSNGFVAVTGSIFNNTHRVSEPFCASESDPVGPCD